MKIQIKGLEVHEGEGSNAPFFVCQVCQKPIRQSSNFDAMIFYNKKEGVIAHKKCMNEVNDNGKLYPSSEELPHFLFNLLHNTNVKPEKLEIDF